MRKVYVTVEIRLIIGVEENINISDIINEMDYQFVVSDEHSNDVDIIDEEIYNWEVIDSK